MPALIVTIPLLAGLVTPFTRRGAIAWMWATLVTGVVFGLCIALTQEVLAAAGPIHYPMGSWQPPFGIEYRVDALNAFVLLVVSGLGFMATLGSRLTVAKEIPADRQHFFYAVWLLCITGLLGMTITGDCFNIYVLIEIASLSSYTLIAMGKDRDRRALPAAINYVILGTIGASFILIGIGYLYMVTGTLNVEDVASRIQELRSRWDAGDMTYHRTVMVAFGFLLAGFAMKMALFPVHGWLPNGYTYAPSAVSTLLPATGTKVGAYVALRFMYTVVGPELSFLRFSAGPVLVTLGAAAVIVGSYCAIRQTNVKRLLAYSSVGQVGYLAMGMGLYDTVALQGTIIHLFNHAIIKGGLFMALAGVAYRLGGTDLAQMRGLGRRMPLTMAAFVLGGFGLVGMPLTAGFVSKWYLVSGSMNVGSWVSVAVVMGGSLLAVMYVWRVVEVAYFQPAPDDGIDVKEAPLALLVPTWMLIGATVWFGIDANLTSRISEAAVRALTGSGS